MIDYWEKNIEFAIYDYPYHNENLRKYNVGDLIIRHSVDEIEVRFKKKDLIIAAGLLEHKLGRISPAYEDEISTYIRTHENSNEFEYSNISKIIYKTIILESEDISFVIKSKRYDLNKEAGIICYYDLDDLYEDEILEEILKEIDALHHNL